MIPKNRLLTALLVLVYLGASLWLILQMKDLRFDYGLEVLFEKTSPHLARYHEFKQDFDRPEELYCLITSTNLLRPDFLQAVDRLSFEAKNVKGVTATSSLLTATDVTFAEGRLTFRDVVQQPDYSIEPALLDELHRNPYFSHTLLSPDEQALLLTFVLDKDLAARPLAEYATAEALARLVERYSEAHAFEAHFVGATAFRYYIKRTNDEDQRTRIPLALLVILAFLVLLYRHVPVMLLCLTVLFQSAAMTLGCMALCDVPVNVMTNYIFILILILGTSDQLHYLTLLLHPQHNPYPAKRDRLLHAQRFSFLPCFLTSFTTAIGFGGLLVTGAPVYTQLGIFSALGVVITFVNSLVFLPLLLQVLPLRLTPRSPALSMPHQNLFSWIEKHHLGLTVSSALALAVAVLLLPGNRFNIDFFEKFRPEHDFTQGLRHLLERFDYGDELEVVLTAPQDLTRDQTLESKIKALATELRSVPGVAGVSHMFDLVDHARTTYAIGADRLLLDRLLFRFLYNYGPLGSGLTADRRKIVLEVRVRAVDSDGQLALARRIHDALARHGLTGGIDGIKRLWLEHIDALSDDLVRTSLVTAPLLALSLFVVTGLSWLWFLAVLVNILPLVLVMACTALMHYDLDMNIIVVSSVGMGIAVDDTIHFCTHLRRHLRVGLDLSTSIANALRDVGTAMLHTSLLLSACFAVIWSSDFAVASMMSELFILCFAFALLGDTVLLPAWLLTADRFRRKARSRIDIP